MTSFKNKKSPRPIIDLEIVYPNQSFKVFYDDYWDCNKHVTGLY